jgi:hypothetical protein
MIVFTRIRKMRVVPAALVVILLTGAWGHVQSQSAPAADDISRLRVLYVGHPGSDREKDFVQFLGQHFETVKTGDLSTFTNRDAEDSDVAILDYDGDGFKAPRPKIMPWFLDEGPKDSPSPARPWFTRPVITVGVAGGLMSLDWGLKTGYL